MWEGVPWLVGQETNQRSIEESDTKNSRQTPAHWIKQYQNIKKQSIFIHIFFRATAVGSIHNHSSANSDISHKDAKFLSVSDPQKES